MKKIHNKAITKAPDLEQLRVCLAEKSITEVVDYINQVVVCRINIEDIGGLRMFAFLREHETCMQVAIDMVLPDKIAEMARTDIAKFISQKNFSNTHSARMVLDMTDGEMRCRCNSLHKKGRIDAEHIAFNVDQLKEAARKSTAILDNAVQNCIMNADAEDVPTFDVCRGHTIQ